MYYVSLILTLWGLIGKKTKAQVFILDVRGKAKIWVQATLIPKPIHLNSDLLKFNLHIVKSTF